jgi:hypothetical protein
MEEQGYRRKERRNRRKGDRGRIQKRKWEEEKRE